MANTLFCSSLWDDEGEVKFSQCHRMVECGSVKSGGIPAPALELTEPVITQSLFVGPGLNSSLSSGDCAVLERSPQPFIDRVARGVGFEWSPQSSSLDQSEDVICFGSLTTKHRLVSNVEHDNIEMIHTSLQMTGLALSMYNNDLRNHSSSIHHSPD